MIINIIEPLEVTEEEISKFFIHQVGLGLPFHQFEKYFNPEDLDRVRELWGEADEKFGELIGDYEMGYIEDDDREWLEYGREKK